MIITLESLINEDEKSLILEEYSSYLNFEPSDIITECVDMFNDINTLECAQTITESLTNEDANKLKEIGENVINCIKKCIEKIIGFFKSVGTILKDAIMNIVDKILLAFQKNKNDDISKKAQFLLENIDSVDTTHESALRFQNMPKRQQENIKDAIVKLEDALVRLCNSGKSGAAYMASITENNNIKFIEIVTKEIVDKNDVMKSCIEALSKSFEIAKMNPEQATNYIKDTIYGTGYGKEKTADNTLDYKEDLYNGSSNAIIHFNSTLKYSASTFEEIFIYWAGKSCNISTNYTHPKNIHANLSKILKNYSASAIPNNVIDYASKLRKVINSFIAENSKNINILTKINNELQSGNSEGITNINYRRFFNIGLKYIQGSEMVMYKINTGLMKYYSNLSNYITMITDTIVSIDLPERMSA